MNIDQSMYSYLKNNLAKVQNRKLITFMGFDVTGEMLLSHIDSLAAALEEMGIKSGESVGICLPNMPQAAVVFYAVNKIGAIANVIHPLMPPEALHDLLKKTNTRFLFLTDLFYLKHRGRLGDTKIIACSPSEYLKPLLKGGYRLAQHKAISAIRKDQSIIYADLLNRTPKKERTSPSEDTAVYLHSGGTTGEPKTVMLSSYAINSLANKVGKILGKEIADETDSMLMVLPLFHGFGLGVCMHTVLSVCGRIVMMPSFEPKKACKLLKKYSVTYMAGVPAMYEKLLNCNAFYDKTIMQSLSRAFCGGDKLPEKLKNRFDKAMMENGGKVQLEEGYGLTEVVTVCSVNDKEDSRFPSVGKALEGMRFMIVDEKGAALAFEEEGEILISGDTLMNGYFNDESLTSRVIEVIDGEKWLHTGDFGCLDSDGFLYFKDRMKRMIKISGMNVFPAEIELTANKMPQVKLSAAMPQNEEGKTKVTLYVVLEDGVSQQNMEKEILDYLSERLMKYSVPRRIVFRKALPLTQIGKVDYKRLEKELE